MVFFCLTAEVSGKQDMIDQAAVMRKRWARSDVTPLSVHRSEGSVRYFRNPL